MKINKLVWVGILVIIILSLVYFNNKDSYNEHNRCYYDNDNTICGKTKYCPTHLDEVRCLELNGTWELETREREMKEK